MPEPHRPFVLTMAHFYGTLAAIRGLGRDGIPVVTAGSRLLAPGRWSRHVSRRVACPDPSEPAALLEVLLRLGREVPGQVLYPTSDDLAWLFARHQGELAAHYCLYQPGAETIYSLLNKKRLYSLGRAVGLEAPETRFPDGEDDLVRQAREIGYPVLLKPQTQIAFETQVKGRVVAEEASLLPRYREFVRGNRYRADLVEHDPGVVEPMLQRLHGGAAEGIYSISGFVDAQGDHALRAARKVLQWPRRLGVGLCFEAAPLEADLAARLVSLCRRAGYYGVFEAEFIEEGGRFLLIDFNPRFYGQLGLDLARGLPLPTLVHAAAQGDASRLRDLMARAREPAPVGAAAYLNRILFELVLRTQRAAGVIGSEEYARWRAWWVRNRGAAVDAVHAADDLVPTCVELLQLAYQAARRPRGFLRAVLNRD